MGDYIFKRGHLLKKCRSLERDARFEPCQCHEFRVMKQEVLSPQSYIFHKVSLEFMTRSPAFRV